MGGKPAAPRRKSLPHPPERRPRQRPSHGNIYLNSHYPEEMLRATFKAPTTIPDSQQYYFPYDTSNDEYGQWDGEGYFFTKTNTEDKNPDEIKPKSEEKEKPPEVKSEPKPVRVEKNPTPPLVEEKPSDQEEPVVESEEEEEEEETEEVVSQEIRLKQRNRRRLALIFGNNDYSPPHQLHNCCKDAEDVATKLKSLNFDCTVVLNAKQRTMLYNEKRFSEKIRSGDCVLFYFSGHAMEDKGKNYLVPIHRQDLKIVPEYDFLCLDDLIKRLSERKDVVNIVVIDGCRTNEKNSSAIKSKSKISSMTAAFGKSLSNRLETPDGCEYMIIYGCEPGQFCINSNPGENSHFTAAFLNHIDQEDKTIESMLKDVRKDLRKKTNGRQRPWIYSCLSEKFFFKP